MEEKKSNAQSVQVAIDMETLQSIGSIQGDDRNKITDDIRSRLPELLQRTFKSMTNWVEEFKNLIMVNKQLEAFQLFEVNKDSLRFLKTNILKEFLLLDTSLLTTEQRKDFIPYLIFIAMKEAQFGKVELQIDNYLGEFEGKIEPGLRQSLLLAKANAALDNKKINVANIFYNKVLASAETSAVDQAYAYRGLAMSSGFREDVIFYHQKAADKFLQAGYKKEAVKDWVFLSGTFAKDNVSEAIALIDKAINIYETENILEKEFSASLYHQKAMYLVSINQYKSALLNALKACELRENLFGNEHAKHASYSLALLICTKLKMPKDASFYEQKPEEIGTTIDSEEFRLQRALADCMDKKEDVNKILFTQIENSQFLLIKFSLYVYSATRPSFSFEEKILSLDKALLLLDKKYFQEYHYSTLYFTLAEVYRNENIFDNALKNYEKSLEHNPFNHSALQNCGALLWKHKKWSLSKDFFKRQIEKRGESPTLCYAYGRSAFELGEYQAAFRYFRKAKGKVPGVDIDSYINICLEKDDDIKLEYSQSNKDYEIAISIDLFKAILMSFSESVSTNSRMHFWEKVAGEYKWRPSPEETGKQLLINALQVKYGKDSIEIMQEKRAGAGIIDLYILLRGGLKVVIELKICGGSGYSTTYALSGEDQLVHYLRTTETKVGFLLVFDGRRRDQGIGFNPVQSIDNMVIYTTLIDLNPMIAKRGKP